MNYQEAKEKLRRRIALDTADLEAIERAEVAVARLSQEESIAPNVAVPASPPSGAVGMTGEQKTNGSADHGALSLTEVVSATIATFADTHAFTKNDLEERIVGLYPSFAGRLDSVSSILWNMANRLQIHTLVRGTGKRPSLYSRKPPFSRSFSPSEIFDEPTSEYEVPPA